MVLLGGSGAVGKEQYDQVRRAGHIPGSSPQHAAPPWSPRSLRVAKACRPTSSTSTACPGALPDHRQGFLKGSEAHYVPPDSQGARTSISTRIPVHEGQQAVPRGLTSGSMGEGGSEKEPGDSLPGPLPSLSPGAAPTRTCPPGLSQCPTHTLPKGRTRCPIPRSSH